MWENVVFCSLWVLFFDQNHIFSQNLPKILNRIGKYPKIHLPITTFLVCFLSILCRNVANLGFIQDCTTLKVRKDEKRTYFYRESVLCPFVEMVYHEKKGFVLSNSCYVDVLYHVESNGFQHIWPCGTFHFITFLTFQLHMMFHNPFSPINIL